MVTNYISATCSGTDCGSNKVCRLSRLFGPVCRCEAGLAGPSCEYGKTSKTCNILYASLLNSQSYFSLKRCLTCLTEYSCNETSAVEVDQYLSDDHYTASSEYSGSHAAEFGRMTHTSNNCWIPAGGWVDGFYDWIQVS